VPARRCCHTSVTDADQQRAATSASGEAALENSPVFSTVCVRGAEGGTKFAKEGEGWEIGPLAPFD